MGRETAEMKAARIRQMRNVIIRDVKEFGIEPDLSDEQLADFEWLNGYEEAREAYEEERWDDKRHGL